MLDKKKILNAGNIASPVMAKYAAFFYLLSYQTDEKKSYLQYLKSLSLFILIFLGFESLCQEKPDIKVGSGLEFNYVNSSWQEGHKEHQGDFGFEMFLIHAEAAYEKFNISTEYRLYSKHFGGGMLKHGWIGYDFNEKKSLQVGLTQVPFGNSSYNSNNWFFNMTYYIGLEDDYDMGIKYTYADEKIEYSLAFFKNAEELFAGDQADVSDSRYSYDISSIDPDGDGTFNFRNKEINQLNGRVIVKPGNGKIKHEIGVSGQYGGIYNLTTKKTGSHYAVAGHYQLHAGRINLKAQIAHYSCNPENPKGEQKDMFAMTAYGSPYMVASAASVYTFCISYTLPVQWSPVSTLKFYNDSGYLNKLNSDFQDSYMNVTGLFAEAGNIYTFIDAAAGKNHPWLGPEWTNALATGTKNTSWHLRVNVNIGYYF